MHAVVFPNSGIRIPINFSISSKSNFYGKEIADGALLFASQRDLHHSSGSSIRSEGNRSGRPRRNISSDTPAKETDKLKDPPTSDGDSSKSSSQEEIIALFRRIQSSISRGGPTASTKRRPNNPNEKQSTESVLGTLRQFPKRKQAIGSTSRREEGKVSPPRRASSEREDRREDASLSGDFEVTRPASKFVKKSPIPPASSTKGKSNEEAEEHIPAVATDEALELQKINEMKLPELKELARAKGVKGYSKLKKGELVELLKGLLQSS